jgi:ATP-dependent DNA helicase PIF1
VQTCFLHWISLEGVCEVSTRFVETISACTRSHFRKQPFGGIILILAGDFAQLPPPAGEFCFKSLKWKDAVSRTVVLTEPMRQREPIFFRALSEIRIGQVSDESLALLNGRVGLVPHSSEGIAATRLRARRENVKESNNEMMRSLPKGGGVVFLSQDKGEVNCLKDLQSPAELRLKAGAQVMLTRSLSRRQSPQLVNGARGVVMGFDESQESYPVVRFRDGTSLTVSPFLFTVEEKTRFVASRLQLPLMLAWTMTTHKSQGMSLDAVEVDVTDVFALGQTYVALSRCTSIEGLYLTKPIEKKHCKANSDVVSFHAQHFALKPIVLPLQGRVFVVEGQFKTHSKKDLSTLIRKAGAKVLFFILHFLVLFSFFFLV